MTSDPAGDALLLLAHEVLQMQAYSRDGTLDFGDFLRDWRFLLAEASGGRHLSLWQSPAGEVTAILCDGAPDWRVAAAAEYRLADAQPQPAARHGSFRLPGWPLTWQGECFAESGIFVGWWPALDGMTGLRLIRRGAAVELRADAGGFALVDWASPDPVDRFEAVQDPATGWLAVAAPWLPCDPVRLLRAYARHQARLAAAIEAGSPDDVDPDFWASEAVSNAGPAWVDLVVGMLHVADAGRDHDALCLLGAQIYGNDAGFFARMQQELDAGTIRPEALAPVLAMEREELFDAPTLAAYQRLAARCGPQR